MGCEEGINTSVAQGKNSFCISLAGSLPARELIFIASEFFSCSCAMGSVVSSLAISDGAIGSACSIQLRWQFLVRHAAYKRYNFQLLQVPRLTTVNKIVLFFPVFFRLFMLDVL